MRVDCKVHIPIVGAVMHPFLAVLLFVQSLLFLQAFFVRTNIFFCPRTRFLSTQSFSFAQSFLFMRSFLFLHSCVSLQSSVTMKLEFIFCSSCNIFLSSRYSCSCSHFCTLFLPWRSRFCHFRSVCPCSHFCTFSPQHPRYTCYVLYAMSSDEGGCSKIGKTPLKRSSRRGGFRQNRQAPLKKRPSLCGDFHHNRKTSLNRSFLAGFFPRLFKGRPT